MKQNDKIAEQRRDIIAKLTQARMEKGVSQAELAGMVGTQRSNTVSYTHLTLPTTERV